MSRLMPAFFALIIPALPVAALSIDIIPSSPTEGTPINIRPWTQMGDNGYESVLTEWSQTGNTISVDWFVKDLHGSGLNFVPVILTYWGLAEIGFMPAGTYDVNATLHMSYHPWYSLYYPVQTAQTSFQVVPEPASLLLLSVGMVAALRRRSLKV